MAATRHLTKAPVIEAILGFQADASKAWDVEAVRLGLPTHFPVFPEVQEQRMFENQIWVAPGKEPESSTKVHPVEAFILRNSDLSAAAQIRRDGFAFSQLQPYPDWDVFVTAALEQWKIYAERLVVEAPFNVFIRFINRVSYPLDGFKLSKFFAKPPVPPMGSSWGFKFFREHHIYSPKDERFTVDSVFTRVDPESLKSANFILDLTITPSKPLAETGDSVESLLPEMRSLKNEAFFSTFTENGLKPYL